MSAIPRRSSRANSSPTRDDITEILPNLFLGSEEGARNLALVRQMGITHILSVMPPELAPTPANEGDGFTRMSIPVQDWPDEELFTHFKATNAFIDHARKTSGEGVLVHCLQGVSRSATIVAAYLMASHPPIHDSVSAIEFLQAQRSIVQPNWGFLEQLALYGRCGCNLEDNPVAVEAWRAGRTRRWEVNKEKRQPLGMWSRMSRWAASLFP